MAVLLAVAGPIKGAVFQLVAEEVTIGRQASSELCVGDLSVSRQHCVIEPGPEGLQIRDLGSNNGTFVNGMRVDERILAYGDKIRVGDTLFHFAEADTEAPKGDLELLDNGVVANSSIQMSVSESADTAIRRLFENVPQGAGYAAQARSLLAIGAALRTSSHEPEILKLGLLKEILEVVPADQAAIVFLPPSLCGESTVTGWNRRVGRPTPVAMSRTLITNAVNSGTAIFSDDVSADEQFSEVTSLTRRRVDSVIVAPLLPEGKPIGAIYLESTDSQHRLTREHLEYVAVVADYSGSILERARRLQALKEENQRLQSALQLEHDLIGCSDSMRRISQRIAKIARTDATVIIRGETGTGKELAARAIHQNSDRAARRFEAINCSLLRETLLESELFGHEKGSFTGAVAQKKGKLELADGGTLFLDELAELGDSPQAMLLRVLQTREFQRLGGTRVINVDIRIIAATNENLEDAVKKKTFRQDLYYRLNVVSITMPPLRERREDILVLADHFVQIYSRKNKRLVKGVSPEAVSLLMRYDWPGNVRELENAIEHAVVFGSTDEILPEDLPDTVFGSLAPGVSCLGYHDAVREAKRAIVRSAMEQATGNYGQAATLLGIHVNNLHRLMRELKLKPAPPAGAAGWSMANAGQDPD